MRRKKRGIILHIVRRSNGKLCKSASITDHGNIKDKNIYVTSLRYYGKDYISKTRITLSEPLIGEIRLITDKYNFLQYGFIVDWEFV